MDKRLKSTVAYLAANRAVITPKEKLMSIFSSRSLQQTPMSLLFTEAVARKYLDIFATIADPEGRVTHDLPDILAMPSLIVDLAQSEAGRTLASFGELYNKVVVNITHLTKINRATDELETSALHELHSIYVKALLVRSYYISGRHEWLTPVMRSFITRTYSLFIASVIARQANLDFSEMNAIASVFALYMTQMLSGDEEDITLPPSYLNITYLGTRADLLYTAEQCAPYMEPDGILTLPSICQFLSDHGPQRLHGYNLGLFIRHCAVLGMYNDSVSTLMSFDYPPYWVHLLLLAVSGVKMSALSKSLQQYNLKTGAMKLAQDLAVFNGLI
jgi:hypothetical protein